MISLNMHTVRYFRNRHGTVLTKDLRNQTFMIRRKMLDNNKSHTRIGRQKGQKLLQSLQSPGRCSNTDNTIWLHT